MAWCPSFQTCFQTSQTRCHLTLYQSPPPRSRLPPLEVVRAATLSSAQLLGIDDELGSVEPGKIADLLIVEDNPLSNVKVLYGHGHLRAEESGINRVGGVDVTLRSGIIYDARELREDVKSMVAEKSAQH